MNSMSNPRTDYSCIYWSLTASPPARQAGTAPKIRAALLQSCHQTLVHLGDLSRYRESELNVKGKAKNWGPAIGNYDLAIAIYPSSGIPHNQLAIIQKFQGDHARALYHLYRTLGAVEPPPTALDNLHIQLKKMREGWEQDSQTEADDGSKDKLPSSLEKSLPLLHSIFFDSDGIDDPEEFERKTLRQLVTELQDNQMETTCISRLTLWLETVGKVQSAHLSFRQPQAHKSFAAAPNVARNEFTFKSFQWLNLRVFSTLLDVLRMECKMRSSDQRRDGFDLVGPVPQRLLPNLRLYHMWLASRAPLLSVQTDDSMTGSFIKAFWSVYAETLTLVLSVIKFDDLPKLDCMLEEDQDIRGFRFLQEASISQPGLEEHQSHELGSQQHDEGTKTLFRARLLLEDAFKLMRSNYVPVRFMPDTNRFFFGEACKDTATEALDRLESSSAFAHTKEPSTTKSSLQMRDNPTNETSYGVGDSTLTALNSVNQAQARALSHQPLERSHSRSPHPDYDPASTQNETSGHSTHQSQHDATSPSQHPISISATPSMINSMPDPAQLSPIAARHQQHPLQRKRKYLAAPMEGFSFDSSNIVVGSSLPLKDQNLATPATPPNGQG
ncbi:MAG: hypothetical protein Q9222_007320 [Ikaeria aurantiellina]